MGEVEENRRNLIRLTREAAEGGARIVVLPETAMQGYMTPDGSLRWRSPDFPGDEEEMSLEGFAEPVPGPSTAVFSSLAKELKIHVLVPLVEMDVGSNRYFNTAVLVGPAGKILAHYRKAKPWVVAECGWASPGEDEPLVVETSLGRIGIMICYDVHEMFERLAGAGADLVLTPVWWVDPDPEFWFTERLPDFCMRYGVALAAANRAATGVKGEEPGAGFSCVISKDGRILAVAGEEEGITLANVSR